MNPEEQAAADEAHLKATLGDRYCGCDYDSLRDDFYVTIVRANGKCSWVYGKTPGDALAAARSLVSRDRAWHPSRSRSTAAAASIAAQAPATSTAAARKDLWGVRRRGAETTLVTRANDCLEAANRRAVERWIREGRKL